MRMMQHDVVCVVGHTPRERVDLSKKKKPAHSPAWALCAVHDLSVELIINLPLI